MMCQSDSSAFGAFLLHSLLLDNTKQKQSEPQSPPVLSLQNIDQRDSPVPDWMGYGFLYGISVIPIVIGVTAAIILFVNSLR